jgi:hypothetical protein
MTGHQSDTAIERSAAQATSPNDNNSNNTQTLVETPDIPTLPQPPQCPRSPPANNVHSEPFARNSQRPCNPNLG